MIAEILPHLRLVRSLGVFDYRVPTPLQESVKRGSFVRIPWRGRQAIGVVWKTKAKTDILENRLSSLDGVLRVPSFTDPDLDLLEWFARTYGVSLGHALKTFFPAIPLRIAPFVAAHEPRLERTMLRPSRVQAVQASLETVFTHDSAAVRFPDNDFMAAWYYGFITTLAADEQLLIVVPEIRDIDLLRSRFGRGAQKKIALFHSEQSKSESMQERKRAASGEATLIIGTKLSVFVPLKNLRAIILHDEGNDSHRQSDQNPRFDARDVARRRAEIHHARLVVCGASLSFRSEVAVVAGASVDASPSCDPSAFRSVELGGQELESPVGHLLREAITTHLAAKRKVFLFFDKRGAASFVQCADCKHLMTCESCGLLLRVVKKHGVRFMMCFRSSEEFPLPLTCPTCAGTRILLRGWGTERIEQDIRESFASHRIQRIDSLSGEIPLHETDIFVGTEYAFKRLPWKEIGMVGIIHVNGLLQLPSYEAVERVWRILATLRFSAPRTSEIILQSIASIPPFLVTGDREAYVQEESNNRKSLFYPPFGRLLILRRTFARGVEAADDAKRIQSELRARFREAFFVSEPITRETSDKKTVMLIAKLPVAVLLDFSWVPDQWIIDIDPPSLLTVQ